MSRAVFFKCRTCDVTADDAAIEWSLNHGDELLRAIWAHRAGVAALYRGTDSRDREQIFGYSAIDDRGAWIARHADHEVVLQDEYGAESAIDSPAPRPPRES